jgi:integrase
MQDKITAKTVAWARNKAKRDKSAVYVWCTELRGFGLRASPTATSWLVQKRKGPRGTPAVRVVIGHYPSIELEQARELAGKAIAEVYQGIDLVERKRVERRKIQSLNESPTLGDAFDAFIASREDNESRYWQENAARFENEVVPVLKSETKVVKVSRAEVRKLIDDKAEEHPGAARNLFALLRPFFGWLEARGDIQVNPMHGLIPPRPPRKRERKLSDTELIAFWKATERLTIWRDFYRLLLLTAQRREEVAGMRWNEIDLAACIWRIPSARTKNGKEHLLHLSPQAMAIIRPMSKLRHKPSAFLFSTTGNTSVSGYSKAKLQLDTAMRTELGEQELSDWRIHDLRRTAASGMASLGFIPNVIERVLNHVSGAQGGLVGVYQQFEYLSERKECIEAWGNCVERLVT